MRLLEIDELRGPHLMLAHTGNPNRVRISQVGKLLDDPLRSERTIGRLVPLDRVLFTPIVDDLPPMRSVRLAMHGLLALDFRNEILQHGCHIANDRHIRLTVLADFRRIDINVNHTRTRSESVKLAGYTIVETSADRNKQIATLHGTGSGNRAMHAKHAKHLRIGIRHNTACGQRGDDRSVRDFRQLLHELAGIGTCRAAATYSTGRYDCSNSFAASESTRPCAFVVGL